MKNTLLKKILCGGLITTFAISSLTGCSSNKNAEFNKKNEITVVSREDGSGTRGAFIELFEILQKSTDGTKTDKTTKEAIIANKTDIMLTNVSGDEYAIGYVSLGSLNDSVKALKIDDVEATAANVKDKSYSVARPFVIATKGEPSGLQKDFIDFILSKEGQAIVAKDYISVDEAALAYSGTKPSGKIVVSGSSSVTPIMEKLKEGYLAINTDAEIQIQASDSTAGMTDTIEGRCSIGMSSRDLKDSEKEQLTGTNIAIDGIAVIVNPKNPTIGLTSKQIKNIFIGETMTWED